jgi:signal transduction histidine kinase
MLVLIGSVQEIFAHSRLLATAAVLEERRRVARDLHDGVAQELAFIHAQAEALRPPSAVGPQLELIASAARRALDESRRAIAALSTQADQRLDVLLAQLAQDVEARHDIKVHLDVQATAEMPRHAREELLRIVREAVANAARHSRGSSVRVSLRDGDSLVVHVRDDGHGFDVDEARRVPGRYGIASMGERAMALGGKLRIHSEPGQGTLVEAVIPSRALRPR